MKVPPVEVRLVSTRSKAFLVVALLLWNALHLEAHLAPSLLSFRKIVKTVLFKWAFYLD